jgi:hypothetical protein
MLHLRAAVLKDQVVTNAATVSGPSVTLDGSYDNTYYTFGIAPR